MSARNIAIENVDISSTQPAGKVSLAAVGAMSADIPVAAPLPSGLLGGVSFVSSNMLTIAEGATQAGMGGVDVSAGRVSFLGTAAAKSGIIAQNTGSFAAGDVVITADEIILEGTSDIASSVTGSGKGASIVLNVGSLLAIRGNGNIGDPGASIGPSTQGAGNAGDMIINAPNATVDANGGGFGSLATELATGNAGQLIVRAKSLLLRNGAGILTETQGQGNAGSMSFVADEIVFSGAGVFLSNRSAKPCKVPGRISGRYGNGGAIRIEAGTIRVLDGNHVITAETEFEGNGGNVELVARDKIEVLGSLKHQFPRTARFTGTAGSIQICADEAQVDWRNSTITSETNGAGRAGNISVVGKTLNFSNMNLLSRTSGDGNAGSITVDVELFNLDGSSIGASTGGSGRAGDIFVKFAQDLRLGPNSRIETISLGSGPTPTTFAATGDSGNISIVGRNARLTVDGRGGFRDTQISAGTFSADGATSGGDINIGVGALSLFSDVVSGDRDSSGALVPGALIIASANGGLARGGSVTITADEFETCKGNISAQAGVASGGDAPAALFATLAGPPLSRTP